MRGDHRRTTGFGWLRWLGWIVAALAIAAAIYFFEHSSGLQRQISAVNGQVTQLQAENARSQKLMDVLTSPDSAQVKLSETHRPARPAGHVVYQEKTGAIVFVASGLRALPQRKSYDLWLIPADGQAPISAGLFRPDSNGSASLVLLSLPEGLKARSFSVTVEAAQGAQTPTLPIVMTGRE
jgi:anti-sigma-K factor RskA